MIKWRKFAKSLRTRIALIIVGVIALAAVILVALNLGDISAFAVQAARAKPGWLALALVSQLATYAGVAFVWARVLQRIRAPLPFGSLYPLAVAKLFADQALPSAGLSGAVFFLHALGARGVPQRLAFTVFAFTAISFFAAFLISAMISLAALSSAENTPPALAASVAAFAAIIIFLMLAGYVIFVFRLAEKPAWADKIPFIDKAGEWLRTAGAYIEAERTLFLEITSAQFGIRLIDGLTVLLVFLAIGESVSYPVCFFAVVIASVAATIGPMPMGLGTFEAGMIAALTLFGVAIENALTATLIFRGLSLWLPLAPGFFVIQREILRQKIS